MKISEINGNDVDAALRYYRHHTEAGTMTSEMMHELLHMQDNPDHLLEAIAATDPAPPADPAADKSGAAAALVDKARLRKQ